MALTSFWNMGPPDANSLLASETYQATRKRRSPNAALANIGARQNAAAADAQMRLQLANAYNSALARKQAQDWQAKNTNLAYKAFDVRNKAFQQEKSLFYPGALLSLVATGTAAYQGEQDRRDKMRTMELQRQANETQLGLLSEIRNQIKRGA